MPRPSGPWHDWQLRLKTTRTRSGMKSSAPTRSRAGSVTLKLTLFSFEESPAQPLKIPAQKQTIRINHLCREFFPFTVDLW
jgi:hypothetical protein